jgi:hypothetical protein
MVGIGITLYCPSQSVEGQLYLSADFWHDARTLLRERFATNLFVLPLTGASGDQSPHIQVGKRSEASMLERRQLSPRQEIARRVVRAVADVEDAARASIRSEVWFDHRVKSVPLPVWKVSDQRFAESSAIVKAGKDNLKNLTSPDYIQWRVSRTMVARYELQKTEPFYRAEIHALRLDDLAIVTNPFELFTDYGLRIKARSPSVQTSVVQLTADCPAYLPTERAVQGGGYSGRIDDGVVGPEGGRVLVEEATGLLMDMWAPPK